MLARIVEIIAVLVGIAAVVVAPLWVQLFTAAAVLAFGAHVWDTRPRKGERS